MATLPRRSLVHVAQEASIPLPERVTIALGELRETAREGLLALSIGVGVAVVGEIFEEEIGQVVGPRGKHDPERQAYRHGRERRQLTLGGRRVEVAKPRGRTRAGEEVELDSYRFFASRDLLTEAALVRMLAGLSTRRYRAGLEPIGKLEPKATARSAISRRFDGGKAIRAALTATFGERVLIACCRQHKRKNVLDHLPEDQRTLIGRKLDTAWREADPERAEQELREIARQLHADHLCAAASLREGLEVTLTVTRLGLSPSLLRTFKSTNPIESMMSVARTVTGNVKRWRDGGMILRWTAAGVLEAEKQFRRVNGYRDLQLLPSPCRRPSRPALPPPWPEPPSPSSGAKVP